METAIEGANTNGIIFVPELDGTPELGPDDHRFFQEMIGMLRWATELGRVDVLHEVSLLSQYQASLRQGHIEQFLHIFAFLVDFVHGSKSTKFGLSYIYY